MLRGGRNGYFDIGLDEGPVSTELVRTHGRGTPVTSVMAVKALAYRGHIESAAGAAVIASSAM